MASEAYLKALKEIPQDIQDDVIGSIEIANEIHLALSKQNLCPADLARRLGKSESEISKWLTGMHNFTQKTVRKIERALETKLLVTNSSKIDAYEKKLADAQNKIAKLEKHLELLERNLVNTLEFDDSLSFSYTTVLIGEDIVKDNLYTFLIGGGDNVRIEPETQSTFQAKFANC